MSLCKNPPRATAGTVVVFCLLALTATAARGRLCADETILCEDFEDDSTPGLLFPGSADGHCGVAAPAGTNSACVDDAAGLNGGSGLGRLFLTEAFNGQTGHAWLQSAVDPDATQLRVEFDLFISGGSNPPADGVSVVFLEGAVPDVPGRGGGGLGTAGLPRAYLSVAFDIWDSGDQDPESACDGPSARTCHAEVNWRNDPEFEPSVLTSTAVPNFAGAGDAGEPVHVVVRLNERELGLTLSTSFEGFGTQEIFHTLLPPAPFGEGAREIHVGLAASTGGANANQAVDNLCISTAPAVPPLVEVEPPSERGGINCGGPAFTALLDGSQLEIAADCVYGEIGEVIPSVPARFVLHGHGRIPAGDDHQAAFDIPIANLPDPSLEPLLQSEVWSRKRIVYRQNVLPGRYAVTVYSAENCSCGLDRWGAPARRYDLSLQGQDALLFFSPAEAAARALEACGGLLSTASVRHFEVDADVMDKSTAYLEIVVKDLGGGAPPENAQLNGFTFARIGETTGEPLSGDKEDNRPPAARVFGEAASFIDMDFEGFASKTPAREALLGKATVSFRGAGPIFLHFQPTIIDGRLRLADDLRLANATSVVFDMGGAGVFDPLAARVEAEFDFFISRDSPRPPADGFVFALVEGRDPHLLGAAGGALAFTGITAPAVGVEVDLWEGGGFGDDSGYNTDGEGHVAVVGSGASPGTVDHVQDQNDWDPELDGTGWVDFLAPEGYHLEVIYTPEARVVAHLTSLDGSFTRRKVLDTLVTPFTKHEAMVGFFAATGGETATMEIDNLSVRLATCDDAPETAQISGEKAIRLNLGGAPSASLDLDGSGSSPGASGDAEELTYRWSASGPLGGAQVEFPCRPTTRVTFSQIGEYTITLSVDDRTCGKSSAASDSITVQVGTGAGPLFIRGDTNCDGQADISDAVNTLGVLFLGSGEICCDDAADTNDDAVVDITDPVVTLNYLFLGGPEPVKPFPGCGTDSPEEDALECNGTPHCP